jgi:hypothetical protein
MAWYRILDRETHRGAGTSVYQVTYIWGDDAINILDRYKKLGGVKRDHIPKDLRPLTEDESGILETVLIEERGLRASAAKRIPIRYYRENAPV